MPVIKAGLRLVGAAVSFNLCSNPSLAAKPDILHVFKSDSRTDGAVPEGGLTFLGDTLIGTTRLGGSNQSGTIFSYDTSTATYQVLASFAGQPNGAAPTGALLPEGGLLYGTTSTGGTSNFGTIFSIDPFNQPTITTIYSFGGTAGNGDGQSPIAGLIDIDGILYGTTIRGGASKCFNNAGCGTIFSYNLYNGNVAVLYSFKGAAAGDGSEPRAGLTHKGRFLYGTTSSGGDNICYAGNGCGTVFRLDLNDLSVKIIHRFRGSPHDGADPTAEMTEVDGILYGTTAEGGSCSKANGCGTLFSITPGTTGRDASETFQVVFDFSQKAQGSNPRGGITRTFRRGGGIVNGKQHKYLYGTTSSGGKFNDGVLFAVDVSAAPPTEKILVNFNGKKLGSAPRATLALHKGTFFGTASTGGSKADSGLLFSIK
jgi:uncharacterized repeat protein (TIGR03803 family)